MKSAASARQKALAFASAAASAAASAKHCANGACDSSL